MTRFRLKYFLNTAIFYRYKKLITFFVWLKLNKIDAPSAGPNNVFNIFSNS